MLRHLSLNQIIAVFPDITPVLVDFRKLTREYLNPYLAIEYY
jgi:hypothetical protein